MGEGEGEGEEHFANKGTFITYDLLIGFCFYAFGRHIMARSSHHITI